MCRAHTLAFAILLACLTGATAQVANPQKGDVTAMIYRIAFSESAPNIVWAPLDTATSPEGQELRKHMASIWDIPSWFVDLETYNSWKNTVQHSYDNGETHANASASFFLAKAFSRRLPPPAGRHSPRRRRSCLALCSFPGALAD